MAVSKNLLFVRFSASFDFRLLQQYRHFSDLTGPADQFRY